MRIALLISGGGTTAEAIIKACRSGQLKKVEPACVIASSPDAGGIARAKKLGIPERDILVIDPKSFSSSAEFGQAIIAACRARNVDFIGQYGWMCLTPKNVIEAFEGRMVNQHPAPLDPGHPDFGGKGMFGNRAVYARLMFVRKVNRDFWTEATAHRVEEQFDTGAVVKATRVPILPDDTVESLYQRLLPAEYDTQIQALQDFADGKAADVVRPERLVRPGEEEILRECKAEAISHYPRV